MPTLSFNPADFCILYKRGGGGRETERETQRERERERERGCMCVYKCECVKERGGGALGD